MTERDYMVAANLTRIRIMKDILRMVDVGMRGIPREEHGLVEETLLKWEQSLNKQADG
jgi:hypothetical protein